MNTANITNYKPKDVAEFLGVSVKTITTLGQRRNSKSKPNSN